MFQDVAVKGIHPFTVLVGANGSGKSTFLDVFGFLRDCLKDNVRAALTKRGGFWAIITRGHETEEIQIELEIPMGLPVGSRLVTYRAGIAQTNEKARVKRELLQYLRMKGAPPGQASAAARGASTSSLAATKAAPDGDPPVGARP